MTHSLLTLRWVPGTLDRVSVRLDDDTREMNIDQIRRLFGREALDRLYLQGSYTLDVREGARGSLISQGLFHDVAIGFAAD